MSVTVKSATNQSSIVVNQGGSSPASILIRKSTGGTLTSLGDVDTSTLQNGFTLVYNSTTNKWEAQAVSAAVASIDGGIF